MTESGPRTKSHALRPSRYRRLCTAVLLAVAVNAPPLFLIPVQIYTANPYDFSATLSDLIPLLLMVGSISTAIVFAALMMVPVAIYRPVVALVTGLAVVIWVQGQLMIWDYGVLDGTPIDWGSFPLRTVTDSLLWLTVFSSAVIFRRWFASHSVFIAAVLLIIQVVPVVRAWSSVPTYPDFHRYNVDDTHKFSFSSNQNVIVLVLDAFQSDVFHGIINERPAVHDGFDGFTYFRNAMAGYSKTYPSLALMLSGKWYENDEPIQEFLRQSFVDNSIPRSLLQEGWRVDMFPHVKRAIHVSPLVMSNAVSSLACRVRYREVGKIVDLGLFRVSPQWAKGFWLNDYRWRLAGRMPACCGLGNGRKAEGLGERHAHAALQFISELRADANSDLEQPAFKLYHLLIPHAPFQLDESMTVTRMPGGRDGFVRQSIASLELVREFLARLRQLDIYDQSTVLILSDHGGGEYTDQVDIEVLGDRVSQGSAANQLFPASHLASGLALLLVKPAGARGNLTISDAPVSLGDVAHTIAEMIDLPHGFAGDDMFDLPTEVSRERRYLFYQFDGWDGDYMPEMTEYRVSGFSWFAENWKPTGRLLSPPAQTELARPVELQLGETIRFRPGSPYTGMLKSGWSEPNMNGLVWSNGRSAEIVSDLGTLASGSLTARFDFLPFTAGGRITRPTIEVEVNGMLRHAWSGDGRGWYELQVPEGITAESRTLNFRFHFPDAASPFEHGLSGDQRVLGIALYRLQIVQREGAVE